jgi:hypothetical protein
VSASEYLCRAHHRISSAAYPYIHRPSRPGLYPDRPAPHKSNGEPARQRLWVLGSGTESTEADESRLATPRCQDPSPKHSQEITWHRIVRGASVPVQYPPMLAYLLPRFSLNAAHIIRSSWGYHPRLASLHQPRTHSATEQQWIPRPQPSDNDNAQSIETGSTIEQA